MEMINLENKPTVVIVDALSTGIYFAPHIRKRGFRTIHVQSSPDIAKMLLDGFRPQDFEDHLLFRGDIEPVLTTLKKNNVVLVIPGAETGVELADILSRRMDLPRNDTTLSLARRNKYMMQENIRARGLRAIREKCSIDLSEILTWAETTGSWPVVLKPVSGAGTEGVHFCNNTDEIKDAFNSIMHHLSSLGHESRAVLAQERINGEECIVNTVSFDGRHYITDHWKYRKILIDKAFPIYDYARLMPHPGIDNRELVKYDSDILDALGFVNGPAHAEIMLTSTGPVLIEVGARLMGASMPPEIVSECIGHNQLDLTLDCFLDHKHFLKQNEHPYRIAGHCMIKFIIAYKGGRIKNVPGKAEIENLSSARIVRIQEKKGDEISKTVDLFTSPGEIILINKDSAVLEADYNRICELEKEGLFELE
jgi:biotin carboxylase